jgi:hypothetical protein
MTKTFSIQHGSGVVATVRLFNEGASFLGDSAGPYDLATPTSPSLYEITASLRFAPSGGNPAATLWVRYLPAPEVGNWLNSSGDGDRPYKEVVVALDASDGSASLASGTILIPVQNGRSIQFGIDVASLGEGDFVFEGRADVRVCRVGTVS